MARLTPTDALNIVTAVLQRAPQIQAAIATHAHIPPANIRVTVTLSPAPPNDPMTVHVRDSAIPIRQAVIMGPDALDDALLVIDDGRALGTGGVRVAVVPANPNPQNVHLIHTLPGYIAAQIIALFPAANGQALQVVDIAGNVLLG